MDRCQALLRRRIEVSPKKTQKQVDRYVSEYGQGAIVYRHGFCEALDLKGAILLDSSPLDLSDLDTFHENNRS